MTYDTVYYWTGGTQRGAWSEVIDLGGKTIEEMIEDLGRRGYVALAGKKSIGTPEGPPSLGRFKAIGMA